MLMNVFAPDMLSRHTLERNIHEERVNCVQSLVVIFWQTTCPVVLGRYRFWYRFTNPALLSKFRRPIISRGIAKRDNVEGYSENRIGGVETKFIYLFVNLYF